MNNNFNYINTDDINKSNIVIDYISNHIHDDNKIIQFINLNIDYINNNFCDNKTLFTYLLYKNCNTNILNHLLTYKCNINKPDNNNYLPIFYTIINNNIDNLQILLNHKANLNITINNINCLLLAINYNKKQILEYLIQNGIKINKLDLFNINLNDGYDSLNYLIDNNFFDINIINIKGNNFLIDKIINFDYELIKWCIEHKININYFNYQNHSALYYCLINNNFKLATYLIYHGADINLLFKQTDICSVIFNTFNYNILDYLLNNGISIYTYDNTCKNIFDYSLLLNNDDIISKYINELKTINKNELLEKNKLFNNYYNFIQILIKNGINFNNISNNKLLFDSIINKNIDNIQLYIKNGSNINFTYNNISCLMAAVAIDNYDIVKLLIDNGVYINYVNNRNENVLPYTIKNHNINIIQLLIDNNVDYNYYYKNKHIIFYFIKYIDIIKYFIEIIHIDINILDNHNNNLLYYAYNIKDIELFNYLISNKIDINNINIENKCVLFYSIYEQNFNFSNILIDNNADVNCLYNVSFMYYLNYNIIKFLVDIKFDFNKHDIKNCLFINALKEKYNFIKCDYDNQIKKLNDIYNSKDSIELDKYILEYYKYDNLVIFKQNYHTILNKIQSVFNKKMNDLMLINKLLNIN